MLRVYIMRRLFAAAIVLFLVSMLVFIMMHLLPGDTLVVKLGETGRIPKERLAELRSELGLDDPLAVQYLHWLRDVFSGSMGESLIYDGQTVSSRIVKALPITVEMGLLGMTAALLIGIPLGVLSAATQDSPIDYIVRFVSLLGLSIPQFWLGLIIIIYGTLYLGYKPPRYFIHITDDPIGNIRMMLIPALVLGFGLSASIMRMTRSTVLEALHEDYARTARAKGLAEHTVVVKHVVRNALIPVLTLVGNQAAFVFSGALILEVLFVLPGMGRLTIEAIQQRDYNQVQGCALVTGAIVVGVNLLVDVAYGWIDPRVRYV
jgi:peptide/nickel transport system permease protein